MNAADIARERQLDWLLAEVLSPPRERGQERRREQSPSWLAAALVLLAVGVAVGVALLRDDGSHGVAPVAPQQPMLPPAEFTACYGPEHLDDVPADVVRLRCYDFTDEALAKLARFQSLQALDLNARKVDARGISTALKITDDGVAHLRHLISLRWLSLSSCYGVAGTTLDQLADVPVARAPRPQLHRRVFEGARKRQSTVEAARTATVEMPRVPRPFAR